MTVDQAHGARLIEKIGLEHLKLERDTQAEIRWLRQEANDGFSALGHCPHGERLHTVEIETLGSVTTIGKEWPLGIDNFVDSRIPRFRFGHDAGPDHVAGQFLDGARGIRIVADEIAACGCAAR